jgi:hypothetical protein
VKYDTAGNFKWLAGPQEDTVDIIGGYDSHWMDMDIDGHGNLHCLAFLWEGIYGGGTLTVTFPGFYMIRYNKDGVFQDATGMEMDGVVFDISAHLTYIPSTQGYYVYGSNTHDINTPGGAIKNGLFIIKFDKDGKFLWKKENKVQDGGGFFGRAASDDAGNIYLAGRSSAGDSFAGYTTANSSPFYTPFIAKLDNAGNLVWARDAIVKDHYMGRGVALRNSGEVVLIADADYLRWQGSDDSVNFPHAVATITRFNTQTGKVLGIDRISGKTMVMGAYPAGISAITAAGSNSVYAGGSFFDTLSVAGNKLISTGGMNDFFLTRWGYDTCGCDDIPEPSFTSTFVYWNTFQFTYTGSQPYNSLLWDFGDGVTSTQLSPTHLFAGGKTFNVTVTVTNGCGDNTYGGVIQTVGVNDVQNHRLAIYPNPATDHVVIEGAAPGSILHVFNLAGQLFRTETIGESMTVINIGDLPAGQYFIKLSAPDGAGHVQQFLKQSK